MLPSNRTPPSLPTLILLSALSVVSLNLFLPSLANIARAFDASAAAVNLAISGYAGVTALLQLVVGPLSDRFGRRPVMLASLAIFAAASVGCLLAQDIGTFLAFRMLQAAIISGYAVSSAAIADTHARDQAASRMGYVATFWALGPMLAPMLGGVLDEGFGWRASFWAFVVLGVLAFALAWIDFGETNTRRAGSVAAQLRRYPDLLRARPFWGYALCRAFSTGTFYAFLGGAPLAAVQSFGIGTGRLGFYMGLMSAGFVLGNFLSGRYAGRVGLAAMMIAGRLTASLGLAVGLGLLLAGLVHEAVLFGACVFAGLGNGLTMPSANAGAMAVRVELAGSAAGINGALALAVGALVSGLTGRLLTPAYAAPTLLAVMLAASLLALAAALAVRRLESRAAPAT
jgi:Bcr/CflA subfamily drug resistance transporter